MSYADKVWAKKADALEFEQVNLVRSAAAKWRDGLIALTALLTAVTIISGPDKASELSSTGRWVVGLLAGLALLALLVGSVCAMRAAYGIPGKKHLLTGENLQAWSDYEAKWGTRFLIAAMVSFPLGVLLIAAAVAVTWFDKDLFPPKPAQLVAVETVVPDMTDPQPYCGKLVRSTPTALVIEVEKPVGERTRAVPYQALRGISIVVEC